MHCRETYLSIPQALVCLGGEIQQSLIQIKPNQTTAPSPSHTRQ